MDHRVLAMVLAGGRGTRLYPLTKERSKPSVPFGGKYRIVDFVLSNLINSGIYSTYVLTQFKSQSLLQHLRHGWQFGSLLPHQFIIPVPAQMRSPGETWYRGTADAIFQNIDLINRTDPDLVLVFSADHIYRMDIRQMIEFHSEKKADLTIAGIAVQKKLSSEFGVMEVSQDGRIKAFHEKNAGAPSLPHKPNHVFASMGNYVFTTRILRQELYADAANEHSSHDFGRDIIPRLVQQARVFAYDFQTNHILGDPPGASPYWRDVGTIDAYFEANMDLRAVDPVLNLYNPQWPMRSASQPDPPAKFAFGGHAVDSIVSSGCVLAGGVVRNSVLGRGVKVYAGAEVEDSILLDNCTIGPQAKVRRAILDKNAVVPADRTVGYDLEMDRGFHHVTESGIVVVEGVLGPVQVTTLQLTQAASRRKGMAGTAVSAPARLQ